MNKQSRSGLTIALMASLAIALILQSFYLARLNRKIEAMDTSGANAESRLESQAAVASPQQPWPDPWANNAPFSSLQQRQQQIESLFGSFFRPFYDNGSRLSFDLSASISPNIEVSESENDYQIVIDVPENGELELSTELEDNTVRVAGSVNLSGRQIAGSITPSFTSSSRFSRSIPLSHEVDPLAMQTNRTDNAIVITIPKV